MQISDRIKKVRVLRNISQKELGILIGFPESSAQVRMAQYENGSRVPKKDLAIKLGNVLDCNFINFVSSSDLSSSDSLMMDLFWLEERLSSAMQIFQLEKYSDKDDTRAVYGKCNDYYYDTAYPPVAITIQYNLVNDFMREWAVRFKELQTNQITNNEYFEWKLNWPKTCDDGGRFEPSYKWRKEADIAINVE